MVSAGTPRTFHLMECPWYDIYQNVLLNSFEKDQLHCEDVRSAGWHAFPAGQQKTVTAKVEDDVVLLQSVLKVFVTESK